MSENKLSAEVAVIATRAVTAVGDELRGALEGLRAAAPKYVAVAQEHAEKAAGFLSQGMSGEIPLDMAKEAAAREAEAIEVVARTALEEGAQAALLRTRRAIGFATEAGIALARVAIGVAVGGADRAIGAAINRMSKG